MNDHHNEEERNRKAKAILNSGKAADAYSDEGFWKKIRKVAGRLSRETLIKLLSLYYCLIDERTPYGVKLTIIGTLGYFILPVDVIPDVALGVGYMDDIALMLWAMGVMDQYILPDHQERARTALERLTGAEKPGAAADTGGGQQPN